MTDGDIVHLQNDIQEIKQNVKEIENLLKGTMGDGILTRISNHEQHIARFNLWMERWTETTNIGEYTALKEDVNNLKSWKVYIIGIATGVATAASIIANLLYTKI